MTISLWFMAWTPYLVINFSGMFELVKISPLFTIWGSLFAKANAVYNPIVYGIRYAHGLTEILANFFLRLIFHPFSVIRSIEPHCLRNSLRWRAPARHNPRTQRRQPPPSRTAKKQTRKTACRWLRFQNYYHT